MTKFKVTFEDEEKVILAVSASDAAEHFIKSYDSEDLEVVNGFEKPVVTVISLDDDGYVQGQFEVTGNMIFEYKAKEV